MEKTKKESWRKGGALEHFYLWVQGLGSDRDSVQRFTVAVATHVAALKV